MKLIYKLLFTLLLISCSNTEQNEKSFLIRLEYQNMFGGDTSVNHRIVIQKDISSGEIYLLDGPVSQYTLFRKSLSDQKADSFLTIVTNLINEYGTNSKIINRDDYHNGHSSICELEILRSSYPFGNLMPLDEDIRNYNFFHENHSKQKFITYTCDPLHGKNINELTRFHSSVISFLKGKKLDRVAPEFDEKANKYYPNNFFSHTGHFRLIKGKIPFQDIRNPEVFSEISNYRYLFNRFDNEFVPIGDEKEKEVASELLARFKFNEYGTLCISENKNYLLFSIKEPLFWEKLFLYSKKADELVEISSNSFKIAVEDMAVSNNGNVFLIINNELYKWSPT